MGATIKCKLAAFIGLKLHSNMCSSIINATQNIRMPPTLIKLPYWCVYICEIIFIIFICLCQSAGDPLCAGAFFSVQ